MKINKYRIICCLSFLMLYFLPFNTCAQNTITGSFPPLAGQQVRLVGFNTFGIYGIDSTKVSEQGVFQLNYANIDRGMGYLAGTDNKAYFVVLNMEDIHLKGESLSVPESILILSGKENKLFVQYAVEHTKREQALSAWDFLQKIYEVDSLFMKQKYQQKTIVNEMLRIKQEDMNFLKSLDAKSYVSWYLPLRKLISSVATVAQYQPHEIPATLAAFRNLNYSDQRLYKSGLLKDAIESHFWLIENSGQPLDTVFKEMNISTDFLIASLSGNEAKFNEITKYLFNLFERRSLFEVSEHLSLKVLTQDACALNGDLAKQLESYRAMKKGNTAPDILFSGDVFKSGSVVDTPSRLSDIQSDYKLVFFGASWCPMCGEELRQLLPLYEKWKLKGIEVVFVSLDTDEALFKGFSSVFPFISLCDYRKWDNQAVNDYYVFATPIMFLLDYNQKIILRPSSIKQVDAWVNYNIGDKKTL